MRRKLERENKRNKTGDERMAEMIIVAHPSVLSTYHELASELQLLHVDVETSPQLPPNCATWMRKLPKASIYQMFASVCENLIV